MAAVTAFQHGKKAAAFALNDALRNPDLASDIFDTVVEFTRQPPAGLGPSAQVRAGAWYTAISVVFLAVHLLRHAPPADGVGLEDRVAALGLVGVSAEPATMAQRCEHIEQYIQLMTTAHPSYQNNLSEYLYAALAFSRLVLDGHARDQIERLYLFNLLLPSP